MTTDFGLATNVSGLGQMLSKIAACSDGGLSAEGTSAMLTGSTISIVCDCTLTNETMTNPRIKINYHDGTTSHSCYLIGDSDTAKGLAWKVMGFGSGDVIVKFAQCPSDNPLDVIPETFDGWGIAAYELSNGGDSNDNFLSCRTLGTYELLKNQNYGGFMLHKMKSGVYAISVFYYRVGSPIYTWSANSDPPVKNIGSSEAPVYIYGTNPKAFGTYTEFVPKQDLPGEGTEDYGSLRYVYYWEPADYPKIEKTKKAVLAPIFCPATKGDYSTTAKWLMQSPRMYNSFDGSSIIILKPGDAVYYCDWGPCACMVNDGVSDTGRMIPEIDVPMWFHLGDGDTNDRGAKYTINY